MKRLLLALVTASLGSVSFAQQNNQPQNGIIDESIDVMDIPVNKYKVETNMFFDNIFFSVGGGAQVLLGDDSSIGKFGDRISAALNVAVGKWFTPGLGLRLQYSGLQARSYSRTCTDYSTCDRTSEGYYKDKWDYMNLHSDVLFNISNMLAGYNPYRFYSAIPFLGFGFTNSFTKPHLKALGFNFGLINSFRLADAWDINLELFGLGVDDKFDGKIKNNSIDVMLGATLGLTFKLPQRTFKPAADIDAIMAMSTSQLDAVNAALAQQIEQNQTLRDKISQAPKTITTPRYDAPTVVTGAFKSIPQSIFFEIGSSVVPSRQVVNIRQIADFMKVNPDATIDLTGYADSSTGTPQWNKELSANRANSVASMLERYGIDRDRMMINSMGGVNTLTPPDLDRRVIMEVHNK